MNTSEKEASARASKLIKNKWLFRIIKKCTAFDPERRYHDMATVKRELLKAAVMSGNMKEYRSARGSSRRRRNDERFISVGWKMIMIGVVSVACSIFCFKTTQSSEYPDAYSEGYNQEESLVETSVRLLGEDAEEPLSVSMEEVSEEGLSISTEEALEEGLSENPDGSSETVVDEGSNEVTDEASAGDLEKDSNKKRGKDVVVFSSELLEEAVRSALDKGEDEDVTYSELKKVASICIYGNSVDKECGIADYRPQRYSFRGDVEDISILAYMKNLKVLALEGQQIKDLSPLSGLKLKGLYLRDNPFSDISALEGNEELTDLDISFTETASLEPLETCENLVYLNCNSTKIASYRPLAKLKLKCLCSRDVPAHDYETLAGNIVEFVEFTNVSKDEVARFKKLPYLKGVEISFTDVKSIEDVSVLSGIEHFVLEKCRFESLDGLENFTNLKYLRFTDCTIGDMEALNEIFSVESLQFESTYVYNYDFLNNLTRLETLEVKSREVGRVYRAVKEPWFEIVTD